MIKRYKQFINESLSSDILSEIEYLIIPELQDNDIEFQVDLWIDCNSEFNSYNIGYIINTNISVNDIPSIKNSIKNFKDRYKTKEYKYQKGNKFYIYESITMSKSEILNELVEESDISKIDKINTDIIPNLNLEENDIIEGIEEIYKLNNKWMILEDEYNSNTWINDDWWGLMSHIEYKSDGFHSISAIIKSYLEDYFKRPFCKPQPCTIEDGNMFI